MQFNNRQFLTLYTPFPKHVATIESASHLLRQRFYLLLTKIRETESGKAGTDLFE